MRRRDERDTQRDSPQDEALLPEHAQLLKPSCWQVAHAHPTPFSRAAHPRTLSTGPCGARPAQLRSEEQTDGALPPDRCRLGWLILMLLGVGSLTPWNAFITPTDYYRLRLRGSQYASSFETIFTTAFTLMGFITIIFMQRLQYYVSLRARIYGSLTACLVTFTVPMALALRPLLLDDHAMHKELARGVDGQFTILVVCTAAAGTAQAILTGSVISYASLFGHPRYIQAVTGGQGLSGFTIALLNFVRAMPNAAEACEVAPSPPASPGADALLAAPSSAADERDVVAGAAAYFGAACLIYLVCIGGYAMLERLPFTIAVIDRAEHAPAVSERASNVSTDSSPKPLRAAIAPSDAPDTPESPDAHATWHPVHASLGRLLRSLWRQCAAICLIYTVTIAIFPALTSSISSVSADCEWRQLFVPFGFVLFNLCDTIGRNLPCTVRNPSRLLGLVLTRLVCIPLFIACHSAYGAASAQLLGSSDAFPVGLMLVFAITNGWLTSSAFVHAPSEVPEAYSSQAAALMVLFLNLGLLLGSLLAFGVHGLTCHCNPFISDAPPPPPPPPP